MVTFVTWWTVLFYNSVMKQQIEVLQAPMDRDVYVSGQTLVFFDKLSDKFSLLKNFPLNFFILRPYKNISTSKKGRLR